MTPCPAAYRIFHDWSEALREASSPSHRQDEELLTSYAGAVGKALDRHLAACAFCKEPTMTQHTPGPWSEGNYREMDPLGSIVYGGDQDGHWVAIALGEDQPTTEANGRLIAAAPELLEALRWAQARVFVHEGNSDVYEAASTAIAKATSAPPDPDRA